MTILLAIAFGFAAILVSVALFSIFNAIYSEHVLERFRRDPASVPMDVVCKHIAREDGSVALLGGCGALVGAIIGLPAIVFHHGAHLIWIMAIVGGVGGLVFKMPFDFLFGPRRRRAPVESLPPNGGGRLPYFAGAILPPPEDPKPVKKDDDDDDDKADDYDSFKVFIAPTMLCAAETYDAVDDNGAFVDPTVFISSEAASMFYDAFDVTSPDFLRLNKENFQIAWRDIAEVSCDPTPKPEKVLDNPNSGSLVFQLKSGEVRELVVLGKRDIAALHGQLKSHVDDAARDDALFAANPPAP